MEVQASGSKTPRLNMIEHSFINRAYRLIQIISLLTDILLYILLAFLIFIVSTKFAYFFGAIVVSKNGLSWRPMDDSLELHWNMVALFGGFPIERALAALLAIAVILLVLTVGRRGILPVRTWASLLLGPITIYIGLPFFVLIPMIVALYLFAASAELIAKIFVVILLPFYPVVYLYMLLEPFFLTIPGMSSNNAKLIVSWLFGSILLSALPTCLLFCVSIWNWSKLGQKFSRQSKRKSQFGRIEISRSKDVEDFSKSIALSLLASLLISYFPLIIPTVDYFLNGGFLFIAKLLVEMDGRNDLLIGSVMLGAPTSMSSNFVILLLVGIFQTAGLKEFTFRRGMILCLLPWINLVLVISYKNLIPTQESSGVSTFVASSVFFVPYTVLALVWGTCVVALLLRFLRRASIARQKRNVHKSEAWLFLRSFGLDASWVKWPFDLLRFLPVIGKRRERLEHVIADCVIRFGPLRAVGNPADPDGDHGIAKEFLSDDAWQPFVLSSLSKACGVIFLFGAGKHISWELERILEFGAVGRTIFVTPPQLTDARSFLQNSEVVVTSLGVPNYIIELVSDGRCICFYLTSSGWNAILNRGRSAFDYRIAIHKSLSDLSLDYDLGHTVRSPVGFVAQMLRRIHLANPVC